VGVERGACRKGLFFMCSCSILKSSADRGISPLAAGPISPSNFFLAFRESRFDGFLDVRERLTLLTLNAGANRPLANTLSFTKLRTKLLASLWHVSCICSNDVQENHR
jgi:hypothetical protein